MTRRTTRRFTLLDAMVLVAAVAVGLGLSRAWGHHAERQKSYSGQLNVLSDLALKIAYRAVEYWPVVALLAPALLLLRLRWPRPRRARLFSPPGMAACVAATVVMALDGGLRVLQEILSIHVHRTTETLYESFFAEGTFDEFGLASAALTPLSSTTVALAVAAVWASMALAGRWRPERSWIDRAGRVVGFLWLGLIPIRSFLGLFYYCLGL